MSITKHIYHTAPLHNLSTRFKPFNRLENAVVNQSYDNCWVDKKSGELNYDFTIGFFGKSGYGKSTTVNKFFGVDIMETSDISACTRKCNCIDYEISERNYISFGDFPGIGESEYRNKEYLKMYRDFIESISVVVYILRADTRDYSIDEKAYNAIFNSPNNKKKAIIAINQCDKTEPISRKQWHQPSQEQEENIQEKIKIIQEKFKPQNKLIPYSATTGWNMETLADEIVKASIKSGNIQIASIEALQSQITDLRNRLASL